MKNLYFIESAVLNRKRVDKSLRNITMLFLICALAAAISRVFFWGYTRQVRMRIRGGTWIDAEIGWPSTVYGYGSIFAAGFVLCYLYIRFKNDLKQPSFGVTKDGIFINQQMLRNAFVPWDNIQKAELLGPAESPFMRLTFKDYTALLKGQPFMLKSIAKVYFKGNTVLSITKGETVGNIRKMHEMIREKIEPGV